VTRYAEIGANTGPAPGSLGSRDGGGLRWATRPIRHVGTAPTSVRCFRSRSSLLPWAKPSWRASRVRSA